MMEHGYPELVIGGVLVAPFVAYAVTAAVLLFLVRPILLRVGADRAFSNPPAALLSLYVVILAALLKIF